MVIIFSRKFDYSTHCVMKWLDFYGVETIRINGDDGVYKFVSISNNSICFRNTITNNVINLRDNLQACWWRRIGFRRLHLNDLFRKKRTVNNINLTPLLSGGGKNDYINSEANSLLEYINYSLYESANLNLGHPNMFNTNRLKVMSIAQKHGLLIPNYEIITTGKHLTDSSNTLSRIVTKAISNGIYTEIENHRFYSYTELVEDTFYKENEHNQFFPSLITNLIEKKFEIRTFFIVDQFYSMAIFSQKNTQTKVDFRKYSDNRREPFKLPKHIEVKLRHVFKELGLNCGSVDLIVNTDDEYVFLEINPVGQFDMTSRPCNYNLHKKVADYLTYGA